MPTVKTTKKDYELFRKEAMKWMQFWGLYDWEISFDFKHAENADATARWSYNDHWAVLTLSDELNDYEYSESFIKRLAFHEVCHVLLAELHDLAEFRYVIPENIDKSTHALIMRLQAKVFYA